MLGEIVLLEFMVQYLTALSKVTNSSKMALVAVELFASLNDEQRTSPEFWMLYNPQFSRISSEMKNYLFSHLPRIQRENRYRKGGSNCCQSNLF